MSDWRFRFRHPLTLNVLYELAEYTSVNWRRHFVEGGDFVLTMSRGALAAAPHLPDDVVFEVLKDNQHEFAGVVRKVEYLPVEERWMLMGLDATRDFLSQRVVNPRANEFVTLSGISTETALKNLITDQLLDASADKRNLLVKLTCDFEIPASADAGLTIDYSTRWISLYDACVELANAGHVGQEIVLSGSNYRYEVRPEIDAISSVIFSVERQENIKVASYSEDRTAVANAVYALGTGTGAARLVELVEDAPDLESAFRREQVIDERDADTTAALQLAALTHMAQGLADASGATFEPLLVSSLEYREDWDVGHAVTVDFPEVGKKVEAVILEVDVTVERSGDSMRVVVGQREASMTNVLRGLFARSKRAQLI